MDDYLCKFLFYLKLVFIKINVTLFEIWPQTLKF